MNIIEPGKQVWRSLKQFVDFLLLSKPFNYTVTMSSQECVEQLRGLSQAKTGFFFYPISRAVKITQEVNHSRFEICVERYGRGLVYNSAKARGMLISVNGDTETTIIKGEIRLGIIFLAFLGFLPSSLFILRMVKFPSDFGFYILWLAVGFFYITCYLRDYRKLDSLIHDTFPDVDRVASE